MADAALGGSGGSAKATLLDAPAPAKGALRLSALLAALARRPRASAAAAVVAAGAVAAAASVLAELSVLGLGVGLAGGGLGAVALAACGGAAVVASSSALGARAGVAGEEAVGAPEPEPPARRGGCYRPVLPPPGAEESRPRGRRDGSGLRKVARAGGRCEVYDFASPQHRRQEDEEAPPSPHKRRQSARDTYAGERRALFAEAGKVVRAWAASLALSGVDMNVNGAVHRLRLKAPDWVCLLIGEDEEVSLIGLSLRLDASTLTLLSGASGGAHAARSFVLEFSEPDPAVEFALTLKVLRSSVDRGAGIWDWQERGEDTIVRPSPLE